MNLSGIIHAGLVQTQVNFRTLFIGVIVFLAVSTSKSLAQLYGNGSDGDHTVVGVEQLTGHKNYLNLTVPSGATLETHGYDVRVSGVLTNAGTITDSYSGGDGGNGGSRGIGGGAGTGSSGANGQSASIGPSGTGAGGNGGAGGGGGGGAYDAVNSKTAYGGPGGQGGDGGKGGGIVRVYARTLDNAGIIHANGAAGGDGLSGSVGVYVIYTEFIFLGRDLAGGGGGGGGGGNGGSGGTVTVAYANATSFGTISAFAGTGGKAGTGGAGINTLYASNGNDSEYGGGAGGIFDADGASGGAGDRDATASQAGSTGQAGFSGTAGVVAVTKSFLCFHDNDGDGFGDAVDPGQDVLDSCGAGFSLNNFDCNDSQSSINPAAVDIPDDGIDQNCDAADNVTCYYDPDRDEFGNLSSPQVFVQHCGPRYVLDSTDNCPFKANPWQDDSDHDGIGDACCCVWSTGNVDCDATDAVDIGDLTALIDNLYISLAPLCCPYEANTDGQSGVDISDLSALIDYLYINFTPPAGCQ